jgi:tRNA (guanine10-N2)-dimethyltransferase
VKQTSIKSVKGNTSVVALFFLVSGEHPRLPLSELKAILDAEGYTYKILKGPTQIVRIQADPSCIGKVQHRAAMTRVCCIELFCCRANMDEIVHNTENTDLASFLKKGESFAVRVKRVREGSSQIDGMTLERTIGESIQRQIRGSQVRLKTPQKTFLGVLSSGRFILGLKKAEVKPGEFVRRGTEDKAFTHSAAMPLKLARCMVNLAQPKAEDLLLDPFCGTGSCLSEAALIGCRVLGLDVLRSMVKGSLRNLKACGLNSEGLIVSDVRSLPLREGSVDCVATDPPYGTSATTLGRGPRQVFESFFSSVDGVLKKGRKVCLAAPDTVQVKGIGERSGFKHIESHFIYIHRSLTREIAVFQM